MTAREDIQKRSPSLLGVSSRLSRFLPQVQYHGRRVCWRLLIGRCTNRPPHPRFALSLIHHCKKPQTKTPLFLSAEYKQLHSSGLFPAGGGGGAAQLVAGPLPSPPRPPPVLDASADTQPRNCKMPSVRRGDGSEALSAALGMILPWRGADGRISSLRGVQRYQ